MKSRQKSSQVFFQSAHKICIPSAVMKLKIMKMNIPRPFSKWKNGTTSTDSSIDSSTDSSTDSSSSTKADASAVTTATATTKSTLETPKIEMTNALAAKRTIFMDPPPDIHDCCDWHVQTVHVNDFSFSSLSSVLVAVDHLHLPSSNKKDKIIKVLSERAFEYGSTWVEHYYYELIRHGTHRDCDRVGQVLHGKRNEKDDADADDVDIIKMLYHWYIAQFTIDYIGDIYPLTSHDFKAASGLIPDLPRAERRSKKENKEDYKDQDQGNPKKRQYKYYTSSSSPRKHIINLLKKRKVRSVLLACRELMDQYEAAMVRLSKKHPEAVVQIRAALDGFYETSVQQLDDDTTSSSTSSSSSSNLSNMTFEEYYAFRTMNAGGTMGFLRQTYLMQILNPNVPLGDEQQLQELATVVGRNVALMNDLYGLKKDVLTGDLNIILKHHQLHKHSSNQERVKSSCDDFDEVSFGSTTTSISGSDSVTSNDISTSTADMEESIQWAVQEILDTVQYIKNYYRQHPHNVETKYNIAMGCVSGDHGFHSTCARYELPENFTWPKAE